MMRTTLDDRYHFITMEAGEILGVSRQASKWMVHQMGIQRGNGVIPIREFERKVTMGDERLVEQSDRYLAEIEDQIPVSQGWTHVHDVVGALPDVPAFLAGHPQCMMRSERVSLETAPLTVFMDLSSSMGIGPDMVLRRGLVLLALVRQLVQLRPVELWVGTNLVDYGQEATAIWRIDTAPLDLARAAFHISSVAMSRLFGYAACEMLTDRHMGGGCHDYERHEAQLRQVTGWSDVMYIPYFTIRDPMVTNPVEWVRKKMRKYVPSEEDC